METFIGLMLLAAGIVALVHFVRKWRKHRREMAALDAKIEKSRKLRAARDALVSGLGAIPRRSHARYTGGAISGRTAIPPVAQPQADNSLIYGAVGFALGQSMAESRHHVSDDSPSVPAFVAGGGDSGGAGATSSWDSGSSSSSDSSSSSSYDSGSSSDSSSSSSDSGSSSSSSD